MAITWRVAILTLVGLVAVAFRPQPMTWVLWLLIVVTLTLVDVALAPSPTKLGVNRSPAPATRPGEASQSVVSLTNNGRRRIRGKMRDAWQPSAGDINNRHRVSIPSDRTRRYATELVPVRRGVLHSDLITVRSLGPLGLGARQRSARVDGTVRVNPAFPSRKHLPSRLAKLQEIEGQAAVKVRGEGTEFDSLREYVRGDDVRSIDWRASGRSRKPVVRTWHPERDRRVVIVLDTGRTSAGRVGDVPRLDVAMDAALFLTALASKAGDRVDFLAGADSIRSKVRGRSSTETFGPIQRAMSELQPTLSETDWRCLIGGIDNLGRHRCLVVLLTPLEPAAIDSGLLPLITHLTARHHVVIGSTFDPELNEVAHERSDVEMTFKAAAAEASRIEREQTAELLRALGVSVIDEQADTMPTALADHYLALKASGRL